MILLLVRLVFGEHSVGETSNDRANFVMRPRPPATFNRRRRIPKSRDGA
jgi:hypothetical protein